MKLDYFKDIGLILESIYFYICYLNVQQLLATASGSKATLNSFRHTFITKLGDLEMSIEDRRVLLSNVISSMTRIYTHPNLEVSKELINKQ